MRCMPMGFIDFPSIWQKNMNAAIWKPVQQLFHKRYPDERSSIHFAIYMDDIFLATKTVEQRLYLLHVLFEHLTRYSLTLSVGKSYIGKRSVFLLGEVISPHQRLIQPERLRALTLLAPPQTVFQVRYFLGACVILLNIFRDSMNFCISSMPLLEVFLPPKLLMCIFNGHPRCYKHLML